MLKTTNDYNFELEDNDDALEACQIIGSSLDIHKNGILYLDEMDEMLKHIPRDLRDPIQKFISCLVAQTGRTTLSVKSFISNLIRAYTSNKFGLSKITQVISPDEIRIISQPLTERAREKQIAFTNQAKEAKVIDKIALILSKNMRTEITSIDLVKKIPPKKKESPKHDSIIISKACNKDPTVCKNNNRTSRNVSKVHPSRQSHESTINRLTTSKPSYTTQTHYTRPKVATNLFSVKSNYVKPPAGSHLFSLYQFCTPRVKLTSPSACIKTIDICTKHYNSNAKRLHSSVHPAHSSRQNVRRSSLQPLEERCLSSLNVPNKKLVLHATIHIPLTNRKPLNEEYFPKSTTNQNFPLRGNQQGSGFHHHI